jgi:hypothetical protein
VAETGDWLGCFATPESKFLSFEVLSASWEALQGAGAAVRDDPVLRARVEKEELAVRLAFVLNWKALRERCAAIGATWPMPERIEEAAAEFRRIAEANGVTRLDEWNEGFGQLDEAVRRGAKGEGE